MTSLISSPFLSLLTSVSLILPLGGCTPQSMETAVWEQSVYGSALVEGTAVEDSWFEDSAFIGHSLIQGFAEYSGLDEPDYYYQSGSSVKNLLSSKSVTLPNGKTGSLKAEVKRHSYDKVYLMMGINEIAGELAHLKSDYQDLIELVHETQPNADIYVLSVLPVTKSKNAEGTFTTRRINAYNDMLMELCSEQSCWYVDLYECFADSNGYLPSSSSTDGIHLKAKQYTVMLDYLRTHTAQ